MALDQDLVISDLVVAERRLERIELDRKRGKPLDAEEHALLIRCKESLEQEVPLRRHPDLAVAHLLRGFAFVSAKPMLVLFNNEDDNDVLPDAGDLLEQENCMIIRGKLEQELAQMSEAEAQSFLDEFEITASATDRVVKASYELMGLISFFTVGEDEVRAWTIRKDTPAVEAAGVIHSDIQKGFIRAEVLSYDDLMTAGTHAEARKRGTVRLEGKTYAVCDGDIINFRFNV
jgi:ribosome-binding ATPase YchF (GTP1/OBG family)